MKLSNHRVLVTGGAGFLGSFLCEELSQHGVQPIYVPRSDRYDLTNEEQIKQLYHDFDPSVVIHLAAVVGGIGANRANPGKFFYDNLIMGANLLEYGRQHGLSKFVAIGTICSYPEDTPVPFSEDDLWEGYPEETNAPYGMAKKMMLVQSKAYRKQYDFNSIFLLPVNLFGPRDDFDLETSHVIPALIRKFVEARETGEEEVTLWGTGSPTREFIYVQDAARAIRLATERYDQSEPVNIGANFEISIRNLAQKLKEITEFTGEIEWDTSRPDGQPRRCLDTSRARERFGFEAETAFEEGLEKTVAWYETHRSQILQAPGQTGFRREDLPDFIKTTPD